LSRLQGKIQVRLPVFNSSEQGNAVGRNLLAKLHPLSRGPPQQIGNTPDDVAGG
jgi:hypothetical protein